MSDHASHPGVQPSEPSLEAAHGGAVSSVASSYREILRSSAIVGGSSAVNVVIGLVRTKAMAVLLGPGGVGLMGALTTISDLARSAAELGINSSGVRQIADSVSSDDQERIARTVMVLRATALILGLLGACGLWLVSGPVSALTFGSTEQAGAVGMLAAVVFFRLIADGQGALLQGMRRLGDIARINVFSALLGTVASIAIVFWLRESGVALSLAAVAAITMLVSWYYSRKVPITRLRMSWPQVRLETSGLLRLGLAFMFSALATLAAAYVVRIILIRSQGLDAAGLYQAAWAVGGMYVAFVLQAMGTDFYPRLVAAAADNEQCNRLVNEQAFVSLILASAGVIGTITLAPTLITVLYSGHFNDAFEVLRWICLGMAMRVATWPLGYILVAKGKHRLFVGVDLFWSVANVVLTYVFVRHFGLVGAGMAFFLSYVLHLLVVYPICRQLTGFRWSTHTARTALALAAVVALVHLGFLWLDSIWALSLGLVALFLSTGWSMLMLKRLAAPERIPRRLARLLQPWIAK